MEFKQLMFPLFSGVIVFTLMILKFGTEHYQNGLLFGVIAAILVYAGVKYYG